MLKACVCLAGSLLAAGCVQDRNDDVQPSCEMCPGTYVPASEVDASEGRPEPDKSLEIPGDLRPRPATIP